LRRRFTENHDGRIAGYSRLVGADDEGTLVSLKFETGIYLRARAA